MSHDYSDNKPKIPSHIAYSIESGNGEKSHWNKIGAAWPTKDGGLSLKLNALPIDGRINLCLRDEVERMRAKRQSTNEAIQKQYSIEPKP